MRGDRGTKSLPTEMLILRILSEGDTYGYQISQLIKEYSEGKIVLAEGAMYPVLYRLQERGDISDYKKKIGKRMERVYYHIEESGIATLGALIEEYKRTTSGVMEILEHKTAELEGM